MSNAFSSIAERSWSTAFAVAGRLPRSAPAPWYPVGNGTVLVVSPHPDDETLGCGGALLRHVDGHDRVVVIQATDGSASGAGGLRPDEMGAHRAHEAAVAARRLGVDLVLLALPENRWAEATLAERLGHSLATVDPDVLYAPSPVDYHPEHLKVARALAAALADLERPLLRIWELGVPLTTALTNLIVDVTAFELQRRSVLAAYVTQRATVASLERFRRYNGAFWQGGGEVECYWQLSPGEYRAVIAAGDWSGRTSPFRGFRPRPFTDPLCYFQGRAERRRLARVASSVADGAGGA